MKSQNKDGISFIEMEGLAGRTEIVHAFPARLGGVSKSPYRSLNLSRSVGDEPEAVEENFRRLGRVFGVNRFLTVSQVHGTDILFFDGPLEDVNLYRAKEFDGIVTTVPGVAIGARTADCLPLFLYDPVKKAIGAVHAGWRGNVKNIGAKAVSSMVEKVGSDPEDILAAIGPCIRTCCFEVGNDVAEAFSQAFGQDVILSKDGHEKPYVDMALAMKKSLISASMKCENIEDSGICTKCREDLYFSHRRDGTPSGRHLNFIMLKD